MTLHYDQCTYVLRIGMHIYSLFKRLLSMISFKHCVDFCMNVGEHVLCQSIYSVFVLHIMMHMSLCIPYSCMLTGW